MFKVGDKVKVISKPPHPFDVQMPDQIIGRIGTVAEIVPSRVTILVTDIHLTTRAFRNHPDYLWAFGAENLELYTGRDSWHKKPSQRTIKMAEQVMEVAGEETAW